MSYQPPIQDIQHILNHIIGIDKMIESGITGDLDAETLAAILEEGSKFASEQLAPLNQTGDQQGCTLENGTVTTPKGWDKAYNSWREAGWAALSAPEEFGGQNLPHSLAQSIGEFWSSANMAFGLCPLLTQGAVDALAHHASSELKQIYLEKMVSGAWTGTMNLTEPQAGSDLAAIRTKAVPKEDGTYAITGTKIFITYGEHDLTENIIHLVLARLPDAPQGTRGISLFVVPKFIPDNEGNPGEHNDLVCSGLEHKLGIHGSPTCVMSFGDKGGATGYLVGEENRGLMAMFTMMNLARLSVGTQGVAVMERSTQMAKLYTEERRQGAALNSPRGTMDPIIMHPDIRRTLCEMKALTMAARAITLRTASEIDISLNSKDETTRHNAANLAALLTPIAKSFPTDCGVEVSSLGIQVHGGMGFIEETGAAQHYRDARILPIYEGTNGIQAIDLVTRKLSLDGGATIGALITELSEINSQLKESPALADLVGDALGVALHELGHALGYLTSPANNDPALLLYAATPLQEMMGLTIGAALLLKGAINAEKANSSDASQQQSTAAVFAIQRLPKTKALRDQITKGAALLQNNSHQIL
jgi:alkylation response protein AidB-like acyl-CoA dehydrogenase